MLRVLRLMALTVACCFSFVLANSQPSAQGVKAPPAEALSTARELLLAMGTEKQFDAMVPLLVQQLAGLLKSQKPGDAAVIDDVFGQIGKRFLERKGEMLDLVAPLYAQRFSASELQEMLVFFKSPVGQRFAAELPGLSQQAMQAGMAWGQKLGAEMQQEAVRELQKRGVRL